MFQQHIDAVVDETAGAESQYGRTFASGHELLGVLLEEFDEFKSSVYRDVPSYTELYQIAAVCLRGMEWIAQHSPGQVQGELKARPPGRQADDPCPHHARRNEEG